MNPRAPTSRLLVLVPGLLLVAVLAAASEGAARWLGTGLLGYETSPISPILVAVVLGLIVRNAVGVPERLGPGLQFAVRRLLRIGVALLGIRLSLVAVASIGLVAIPIVVGTVTGALVAVAVLSRGLGLSPRLGTLVAAGTSICGITAIVATAPAIEADEDETSYAVATIALFGMAALLLYPFVAHALFGEARRAGLFLGVAIHDTSQVVGAALAYQQQYAAPLALETAVVTKLVRNLFLIAVVPLLSYAHGRTARDKAGTAPRWTDHVPLFVLGFLGMALLRTVGDLGDTPLGVVPPESWAVAVDGVVRAAELLLLLAMAAVGLGTSLDRLRALGARPLAVGLAAALIVGAGGAGLVYLLA